MHACYHKGYGESIVLHRGCECNLLFVVHRIRTPTQTGTTLSAIQAVTLVSVAACAFFSFLQNYASCVSSCIDADYFCSFSGPSRVQRSEVGAAGLVCMSLQLVLLRCFVCSPTGHASLMKSSSDDMLDVLLAEDTEEGRRARELLLHNTELNSSSPPVSGRSLSSESFETPSLPDDAPKGPFHTGDSHSRAIHTAGERGTETSGAQSRSALSILECHLSPSS